VIAARMIRRLLAAIVNRCPDGGSGETALRVAGIAELERAVEIAIDERDEARKEADFWREQATEDRREER